MKKICSLVCLLVAQLMGGNLMSQSIDDSVVHQKLSVINDSIKLYLSQGDNQKVISICKDGISFLSENELFFTPASNILCHLVGESSLRIKDYETAKMYLFRSFIIDEIGGFGFASYNQTIQSIENDDELHSFKALLDFAKADSSALHKMALKPREFGFQLNTQAWDYYNHGSYESALALFEMEQSLFEAIGEVNTDDYLSIFPCEIRCLTELKNYTIAIEKANVYLNLVKSLKGEGTVYYALALQSKANVEQEIGDASEAVILYNSSLDLIESLQGKHNMDYIRCLQNTGRAYQKRDNNNVKYLELELEVEKLLELSQDATVEDKVRNFNYLSLLYNQMGDKVQSLNYAEKSVLFLEDNDQIHSSLYANQLSRLCSALTANSYYSEAIRLGEKSVDLYSELDCDILDNMAFRRNAISELSRAYFESGNMDKAISTLKTVLTNQFPNDEFKIGDYQQLATYYQRVGLKKLEIETIDKSLKLAEEIGGKHSVLYAEALIYASTIQEKKGDAVMMMQEAVGIFLELEGSNSDRYLSALRGLEIAMMESNSDEEQIEIIRNTISDLSQKLYGYDNRVYYRGLIKDVFQKGEIQTKNKDVNNLCKTVQELDSISIRLKSVYSQEDELYFYARNYLADLTVNLFEITFDINIYKKAVDIQADIVSLALHLHGEDNEKYIHEVEILARVKSSICPLYFLINQEEANKIRALQDDESSDGNNLNKAWECYLSTYISKVYIEIRDLEKCIMDYYKQFSNSENPYFAHACKKLADSYFKEYESIPIFTLFAKSDDTVRIKIDSLREQAEQLYNTALSIYKDLMDYESVSNVLLDLYSLYDTKFEKKKASDLFYESFQMWKRHTLIQLSMMTSAEKSQMVYESYWESQFDFYNGQAYYQTPDAINHWKYAEVSYDAQLLRKGLLLKSETGLRDLLLETGNGDVIMKYDRLRVIQQTLSNPSDKINTLSLVKEYQSLERQLLKESELYGNYLRDFSYTFNDVKSCLGNDEIAIEFCTMRYPSLDSQGKFIWARRYFALVLKNNYSSPRLFRLADKLNYDSIYQSVWEPLMDEIKGAKNVYFSPISELNNLPIESVTMSDGSQMSELGINFYRVSSTREIIKHQKHPAYNSIVLYGGLNYDTDLDDMIASNRAEHLSTSRGIKPLDTEIEKELRNSGLRWKYLAGTKKEVSEIERITTDYGVKPLLYSANEGTESSFKKLSGEHKTIIHIATHGFFINSFENYAIEEQLARSGLAFAGANIIPKGLNPPIGVDDGILTAEEISQLDLRKVNLVVLSACDTGLGKITNEGVYGLQRGFKKAGVQSLLMSLWKVDDEATQILMTNFYKHLFNGKSKQKALDLAQKELRHIKGFEDPYYWAAFVLLDGLD